MLTLVSSEIILSLNSFLNHEYQNKLDSPLYFVSVDFNLRISSLFIDLESTLSVIFLN